MEEDPTDPGESDPEEPDAPDPNRWRNLALVVVLRIVLVGLVVVLGIIIVSRIVIDQFDLHSGDQDGTYIGGPVPVSPITSAPATSQPSSQPTGYSEPGNLPSISEPPAPTDIPPADAVPPGLVLIISPSTIASGQSFSVSGTYAGRDGVQLQLQRLENGIWADYPNDISVAMGNYSTTAASTMTGTNSFRVYDQSANRASNVVSILVR